MQIKEFMTPNVEFIHTTDNLKYAAEKMQELNIGIVPVFEDSMAAGVLTDRDIVVRAIAQGWDPIKTRVSAVMTKEIVSCLEDAELKEAAKVMEEKDVHRLLVKNSEGRYVGILSLGDVAVRADKDIAEEILADVSKPYSHSMSC
ncbi:MAG: CBS domain-containing protein [bacterium]